MNKKIMYIFGGGITVLLIFTAVIFFQQGSQTVKTTATGNTNNVETDQTTTAANPYKAGTTTSNATTNATTARPTQDPQALSAQSSAKAFYTYYFSSATNPLADGKYKTNQYLSEEFKDTIRALYNDGNDPVFCPQNRRSQIVIGQERQVYYDGTYMTQLVISEAPPGNKQLYRLLMENLTGVWLVDDVNCIK